jgi:hypothetical protein
MDMAIVLLSYLDRSNIGYVILLTRVLERRINRDFIQKCPNRRNEKRPRSKRREISVALDHLLYFIYSIRVSSSDVEGPSTSSMGCFYHVCMVCQLTL